MPRRIAISTLSGTTLDILNVIRQNASPEYQQNVPVVEKYDDVRRVGQIFEGTPAFANQFINALVNRIALVRINSATFNNPYARLKKGMLEYGETVEEIFVDLVNCIEYNADKAPAREFKRTVPDVKSAFHVMNWRVMYPITIQKSDIKLAFLSEQGVTDLINKILNQVYTSAEYDEFLLFKYMLIKGVTKGHMYPVTVGDGTDLKEAGVAFRGTSNMMTFMRNQYNEKSVRNNTPKERQIIFMDSMYNADYDVNVLASAFNMDKAEFMVSLFLIDDWTSFDNERFDVIRASSDGIEEVTQDELDAMKFVKAILVDESWFQIYDNLAEMGEQYVASGLYWNYFYHTWKTISYSPFHNAVVFLTNGGMTTFGLNPDEPISGEIPDDITATILSKEVSDIATIFTLGLSSDTKVVPQNIEFVQYDELSEAGIAVHPYGAIIIPKNNDTEITLAIKNVLNEAYIELQSGYLTKDSYVGNTFRISGEPEYVS